MQPQTRTLTPDEAIKLAQENIRHSHFITITTYLGQVDVPASFAQVGGGGLTSPDDAEIRACVQTLRATHAGTGFMHESFHKDNPRKFTRAWFAWANTLFGEFLWKVSKERPQVLG